MLSVITLCDIYKGLLYFIDYQHHLWYKAPVQLYVCLWDYVKVSSWQTNFHPTPSTRNFPLSREIKYVSHNILNRCHEDCKERNHSKQSLMYSSYAWLLYQIVYLLSRVSFGVSLPLLLCVSLQVFCNRMGDAICVSYQYVYSEYLRVCYEYSYSFDPQSHYTDLYKCCQGLIWCVLKIV